MKLWKYVLQFMLHAIISRYNLYQIMIQFKAEEFVLFWKIITRLKINYS